MKILKKLSVFLLSVLTCLGSVACQFNFGTDSSSNSDSVSQESSSTVPDSSSSEDSVSDAYTEEELLEGLIDLREAKLAMDKARIMYRKNEDKDGDGRFWKVNVENLTDGTLSLFTLSGNFDFDWVPEGLFGAVPGLLRDESTSVIDQYLDKTIGFWVRSPADCIIKLEGLSSGWERIRDTANQVELTAGKWTYVEFYLGSIARKYYYYANISCNAKTVMDIDGFQILDEPTLQSEFSIKSGKVNPEKAKSVYMPGQDADADDWLYTVETENFNDNFQNVVAALSGAAKYNVANGTEGNWCPNGMLGIETYGANVDKCFGVSVKTSKKTTLTLKCMNSAGETMEISGSEQVVEAGTWSWIEFDLGSVPEEYRYVSCIVASTNGTIQMDEITLFKR